MKAITDPELQNRALEQLVDRHLNRNWTACQIVVTRAGRVDSEVVKGVSGEGEGSGSLTATHRFDLASLTKLFTTVVCLRAVEQGLLSLDQTVQSILPEFSGRRAICGYPDPLKPGAVIDVVPATTEQSDPGVVTIRHLLTHSSGLPAWLPLFDGKAPELAGSEQTLREIRKAVLSAPFSYPTGSKLLYSDIGYLVLGYALEAVYKRSIKDLILEDVIQPLGLKNTGWGPISKTQAVPTEFNERLKRRLCGEVHDDNSSILGGVAPHAGLFGTAMDLAQFGESFLVNSQRRTLLSADTCAMIGAEQVAQGDTRRGLGFLLRSLDPAAMSYPWGDGTIFHFGFTGTSLWIDPSRDLVVAALTNRVYFGRDSMPGIAEFRRGIASIFTAR